MHDEGCVSSKVGTPGRSGGRCGRDAGLRAAGGETLQQLHLRQPQQGLRDVFVELACARDRKLCVAGGVVEGELARAASSARIAHIRPRRWSPARCQCPAIMPGSPAAFVSSASAAARCSSRRRASDRPA